MKTFLFNLMLSLLLAPSFANAVTNDPNAVKKAASVTPADDEALYFDPEHHIWFQERVYIHITDMDEKQVLEGTYSKEDLATNKELRELLRKSTHYLTVDSHYYYFLEGNQDSVPAISGVHE